MANIPIHNETDYILTEAMREEIIRDAHDHFGDEVGLIRVQAGLERHALNTRTREIRYAFFPQDFGMGGGLPIAPMTPARSAARPQPAEETEVEELPPHSTSLARFEAGRDNREDDDRFRMDNQNEDEDEEDEEDEDEDEEYEEDEEIA